LRVDFTAHIRQLPHSHCRHYYGWLLSTDKPRPFVHQAVCLVRKRKGTTMPCAALSRSASDPVRSSLAHNPNTLLPAPAPPPGPALWLQLGVGAGHGATHHREAPGDHHDTLKQFQTALHHIMLCQRGDDDI
jgi:hypothetical protein